MGRPRLSVASTSLACGTRDDHVLQSQANCVSYRVLTVAPRVSIAHGRNHVRGACAVGGAWNRGAQGKRELQEEYRRISEETNQKITEAQKRKDMDSCPDGTPQGTSGCLERKGMTPDQYFNKELEIYAAEMTRMQKSAEATAAAKILSQAPPTPSPSPAGSQSYKSIYQARFMILRFLGPCCRHKPP